MKLSIIENLQGFVKKNLSPVYLGFAPFFILLIGCSVLYAQSNPKSLTTEETVTENSPVSDDNTTFMYELENRLDPFVPFLTEKSTSNDVDMDEIVETTGNLTGMQLFEPGQLTLVALLSRATGPIAMVQDFTGKGYTISIGTKIGRRGVVKNIIPNKVLIEETAFTRAGKKIVTQTVMALKKEGEE